MDPDISAVEETAAETHASILAREGQGDQMWTTLLSGGNNHPTYDAAISTLVFLLYIIYNDITSP